MTVGEMHARVMILMIKKFIIGTRVIDRALALYIVNLGSILSTSLI